MANIPGISGFVQPGTFARDRVVSRGISIPGGARVLTIMGLGETSQTLVDGANGGGQDGIATPSGADPNGRFFQIAGAPLESGRVRIFLNGSELSVYEGSFNGSDTIKAGFDSQVDLTTGVLGLQSATFQDQGGKDYAANPSNVGDGEIETGLVGTLNELEILDLNTPSETWTLRCTSVSKDATGINQKGQATFSCVGSVSGQLRDQNGNALVFSDTYKSGSNGVVYGNTNLLTTDTNGYELMDGVTGRTSDMGVYLLGTSSSATEVKYVAIPLDATGAGDDTTDNFVSRIMANDFLVSTAGGANPAEESHKIDFFQRAVSDDLFQDGGVLGTIDHNNKGYAVFELNTPVKSSSSFDLRTVDTTLDLSTSSIGIAFTHATPEYIDNNYKLIATNAFVNSATSDFFTSKDVGKILLIDGVAEGRYTVSAITEPNDAVDASSSVIRVHKYGDEDTAFPSLTADETVDFSLVETNGVLSIGIDGFDATNAFSVGDKFTIKIDSKTLVKDDLLEAKYISTSNINDPEFFTDASELFIKHGSASLSNTLSLGAQMAYENGAPGILATQCKPPVARRTSLTLVDERSNGAGGLQFDSSNIEVNDAIFTIPVVKQGGYRKGRPDGDTQVNIFRIRDGKQEQIFPNKSTFYSAAQSDSAGKTIFVNSGSDFAFSYTICENDNEEFGGGIDGRITLDGTTASFTSETFNFDSEHDNKMILIKSLTDKDGNILDDSTAISGYLGAGFDVTFNTVTIESITSDTTVELSSTFNTDNVATNIIFTVLDTSSTENTLAAILFNKSIFTTNTLKNGDGLKIEYIDQNDADFFDTNWFTAFETLEAFDTQIIVPLPSQTKSNIFQASVAHCETMSTIANRKERLTVIGAISGVNDKALLGTELVAVEDIGVLEGIQGDDPEEVLDGNIEDLQNFKLSDNYTSNRSIYMFPDQIVRNISGTNTLIDGFYMAAAAGGRLAGTQNVAVPLTNKTLSGFNILRDRVYSQVTLNQLGNVGATVVVPVAGGGRVLAGRTTSNSGFIEDEEISVMFIRDQVKSLMRSSLQGYIGSVQDSSTNVVIQARIITLLNSLINQGLIESFRDVSVSRDKVDPRQINVFFRFVPTFPINYVFIDIELGIS